MSRSAETARPHIRRGRCHRRSPTRQTRPCMTECRLTARRVGTTHTSEPEIRPHPDGLRPRQERVLLGQRPGDFPFLLAIRYSGGCGGGCGHAFRGRPVRRHAAGRLRAVSRPVGRRRGERLLSGRRDRPVCRWHPTSSTLRHRICGEGRDGQAGTPSSEKAPSSRTRHGAAEELLLPCQQSRDHGCKAAPRSLRPGLFAQRDTGWANR